MVFTQSFGPLKTSSGLEPVRLCEPCTYCLTAGDSTAVFSRPIMAEKLKQLRDYFRCRRMSVLWVLARFKTLFTVWKKERNVLLNDAG